jgi:O-antigen/teichoic acid export membrane protein
MIKSFIKSLSGNINIKAGGLYLFGNLFDKAIIFLTIPIFTRILSTSDYGIVNTYLSWVSTLSLIVGLSLGSSLRSAVFDFKDELDEYLSSIFFLSLLNFIVTSSIIIFITWFYIKELDIVLVILCLIQAFMTFVIVSLNMKYMMTLNYVKRSMLLVIPNLLIVVLSVVLIVEMDEKKYLGRIIPYVLISTLIGTFILAKSFTKSKIFYNKRYWTYGLRFSVPLIFHGLSINILAVSDRSILLYYTGASATGIYSFVYSVSMIAIVVTSSLESIWIPWFTKAMQIGDKNLINRYVKLYIGIGVTTMIVVLLLGPEIITVMSPKEFWIGKSLLQPILLSSFFIFIYSISVNLEYYYKSTKIIAYYTIISALINLGLNFIFIPKYGAVAAAYTTVISYFITFVLHYQSARNLDNELFPLSIYIKPFSLILLFTVISYFLFDMLLIRYLLIAFIVMVFCYSNKNIIKSFLSV